MASYVDAAGVTNLTNNIKTLADATYPANASIANNYDATTAYDVDNYCIYDGLLYKCKTAIAAGGEEWNSSHWTQVNIVSEMGNGLPHVSTISLTSANWTGKGPYTQIITVTSGTPNSKIDLQPSPDQVAQLIADSVSALLVENNNGTFTAYAIGSVPTIDMIMQITITETG